MVLAYKYRLLPTRAQHAALVRILEEQRLLYNAALEERIGAYRNAGLTRTYVDQCKALTEWRSFDTQAAATPTSIQRWTLRQIENAYKSFFRRAKAKEKAGFPRFRGKGRWRSFGFNEFIGISLKGRRLRWRCLPGSLRVHMHRELPSGDIRGCIFTWDSKGWHVCLQVAIAVTAQRTLTTAIGVDVGLTHLATLSTGETIPNPRHAKRVERELRRRQRALSRCKRGSNRRKKVRANVARLHRKTADARSTYLHQVSAGLVNRFDVIAIEKLNVRGLAKSMLAKSVHDASWYQLRQLLAYKAEYAGAQLIEVDPRYTSQTCPDCGQVAKKELSQRIHSCDCGCTLDRDHAAARVILSKAVVGLGELNVTRQWCACSQEYHLGGKFEMRHLPQEEGR